MRSAKKSSGGSARKVVEDLLKALAPAVVRVERYFKLPAVRLARGPAKRC